MVIVVTQKREMKWPRLWLLTVLVCVLSSCTRHENTAFNNAYQGYKALFIDAGRVVDTGNQNVSHSESQGYGMLFSVVAGDQQTFDSIWQWTQATLQRKDKLFSWRYVPCESADKNCIDDDNNASDGDLLIAWALLRAAAKWDEPRYQDEATNIIKAVETSLFYQSGDYHLLLPGEFGFIHQGEEKQAQDTVQINLSYWVFPAINALAKASNQPKRWQQLFDSGVSLINRARFGAHQLPPDWLGIKGETFTFEHTLSQDYGFNACRIPLHLAWAGVNAPNVYSAFLSWWKQGSVPATVNVVTGEAADYEMSAGMKTVADTVAYLINQQAVSFNQINRHTDYYSASLIMLSRVAVMDTTI
ncbi:glycosyl hydrolase family 8 [Alteromonas profundi]|nr:glycosyl hydrolase family 8 [Alteromonas profundi]